MQNIIEGESSAMLRSEQVRKSDVRGTLQWLCNKYNDAVTEIGEEDRKFNQKLSVSFCSGQISKSELISQWKASPKPVKVKNFKHMTRKFCKRNQYTKQSTNTSGNYLEFDDVKMQENLDFEFREQTVPVHCILFFLEVDPPVLLCVLCYRECIVSVGFPCLAQGFIGLRHLLSFFKFICLLYHGGCAVENS